MLKKLTMLVVLAAAVVAVRAALPDLKRYIEMRNM